MTQRPTIGKYFKRSSFLSGVLFFPMVLYAIPTISVPTFSCQDSVETLAYINGTLSDAYVSYDTKHKSVTKSRGRYWRFTTERSGIITIAQKTLSPAKQAQYHRLLVGTQCNHSNIFDSNTPQPKEKITFYVEAGETYYVKVEPTSQLNVRVSFDFKKQVYP